MEEKLFLLLLFITSLFSVITVLVILRRKEAPGAAYYILVVISSMMWINGYIVEIIAESLQMKFFGAQIQYFFGIPFIAVFWFASVRNFISNKKEPAKWEIVALSIIPAISMLLLLFNDTFHLMYKNMRIGEYNGITFIAKDLGGWYYVHIANSYLLLAIGAYYIIKFALKSSGIFRKQAFYFLWIIIFPLIASLVYVLNILPGAIDITTIAFGLAVIVAGINIFKYNMFDLIPAARDTIVEALSNGILVIDIENRVIDANPVARKIFNNEDLIGKSKNELFKGLNLKWNVDTSKSSEIYELEINDTAYELIISEIDKSHNRKEGQILTFYDVTERQRNKESLENLNLAKDKLFSIIAHDLKNPFMGLIGLSEMLYTDYDEFSDDEKKKIIKDINELSTNTHQMLENLLDWSRQQTGRIEFSPEEFDINKLVKKNVDYAGQQAVLKHITCSAINDVNIIKVFADFYMIDTVLRNLISNAIKFTKPGGSIEVITEKLEEFVKISVKDNGVGITEKVKKKLFFIGSDIKSVGTTGEKGTGLGLVICKEFIEKNGGKIAIESVIDKGSTFYFTVPLVK